LAPDDPKRNFIMQGVKLGFKLSELDTVPPSRKVLMKNYFSTFKYRHAVESQILEELEEGRYIFSKIQPSIVSALGAIPKKQGGVRLIHDCSRPAGNSVNDNSLREKFKYQNIQDAIDMVSPGDFMAKVDLKSAYRSVKVNRSEFSRLGIHWTFEGAVHPTYMVDTCLPFGHARSPFIFNELSQAVCRIMKSHGFELTMAYLDDFLLAAKTYEECKRALIFLMSILRRLGFAIAYSKVEGPVQRIVFLGFLLDTIEMSVALTRARVQELNDLLQKTLKLSKVTKKGLQSIIGKLNYCTQVVYGGRYFLRRLIDVVATLAQPWHRTRVTREMKADIDWWLQFGLLFCSKPLPMVCAARPEDNTAVCVDACGLAAGGFFMGDHCYSEFSEFGEEATKLCINYKEVLALLPAVAKWAPFWENKTVHVYSDNVCAVNVINKGSTKNPIVMDALRNIFYYSVIYNFRIKCHYYPGVRNQLADAVSRLHERFGILRYQELLARWYALIAFNASYCNDHKCLCHNG